MPADRHDVAPRDVLEKGPFGIKKLSLRKYRVSDRTVNRALWGSTGKPPLPPTEQGRRTRGT
jgi:hypothetical protein